MAGNLLDLIGGYLTPSVVNKMAGIVGESPDVTQKAVNIAIPTLAGSACNQASTPNGAAHLLTMLSQSNLDSGIVSNFTDHLGGGPTTQYLMTAGENLLHGLLGNNASKVSGLIGNASGMSAAGSSTLLSLIAPLFFATLGREVTDRGLSASGLSSLLSSHRDTIQKMAPASLASALGVSSMENLCGAPAPVEAPMAYREPSRSNKWIWALPLIALLALIPRIRSCARTPTATLTSIKLPCGTVLKVPRGSFNDSLATFMLAGSDSELPKDIVFDHLNFDSATTRLTPDSDPTVANLVSIMKCYPAMHVRLEGYTDNTGDSAANKQLSLDRANAIQAQLVQGGVDPDRISTDGWGDEKPVASNDTEEGRAKNRRTELVVLNR
jgi:outer membrane protein OmpA-like peptidoglycan-associated protein